MPTNNETIPPSPADEGVNAPGSPGADSPGAAPAELDHHPQLARAVGRGMTWMIGVTIFNKLLTSVAQVVLGWKLEEEDFSKFAIALAAAGFVSICREAGMRELLARKGVAEYERLAGPAFWLAFWYNVAAMIATAAAGYGLGQYLGSDVITWMMLVFASSMPVGTVAAILQTKMRVTMDFRGLGIRTLTAYVARQGSAIIFALLGMGAMSQAWPVLLGYVVESVTAYAATKDKVWERPAKRETWPGLLRESRWAMFGSVAFFTLDWGPFAVLRPLAKVSDTVNGTFYFAFSITAQVGVLLSHTVTVVLTPALARMNENPERQGKAALRGLRALMLLGAILSLGLAACIQPLEDLLWHGKWAAAVPAVMALGVFFPWRVTWGLTSALLMARGRFKAYALSSAFEGAGLIIACVIGALVEESAFAIALAAGIWLMVSRVYVTAWTFRPLGVSLGRVLAATVPPWGAAIASAAAGWLVATRVLEVNAALAPRLHSIAAVRALGEHGPRSVADLVEVAVAGGICTVVFAAIVRTMLAGALQDTIDVAPARLRPLARRLLALPERSDDAIL
ncbi:MAG TPA: oligosaccharide flippase family protein [Phycisphaerales bacterium]|nr:oligosaccharide flippase family protein [Phycisphaerales bacterium]